MGKHMFPVVSVLNGSVMGCPGAHHRLVSAKMALQACESLAPEAVALEVPAFALPGLEQALRELYPIPCAVCLSGPGANQGCAFAVAPSDSICQAARWALSHQVPLFGVDLLLPHAERREAVSSFAAFDDWAWDAPENLPDGIAPWSAEWGAVADEGDRVREEHMAARLAALVEGGFRSILWVGGAAHWSSVAKLLSAGSCGTPCRDAALSLGLACKPYIAYLDPELALARFLDDLPHASWRFHCATQLPTGAGRFQKWEVVDAVVGEAVEHYGQAFANGVSPRAARHFQALLRKLVAQEDLVTPRLHHLYAAGKVCLGDHFGRLVVQKALEYPFAQLRRGADREKGYPLLTADPARPDCLTYPGLRDSQGLRIINCPSTHVEEAAIAQDADSVHQEIRRAARQGAPPSSDCRWDDCIPEAHAAQRMHHRARQLAREVAREFEVQAQPFSRCLTLGDGVDVRATVRARTRGHTDPLVKIPTSSHAVLDDHEPVVWDLQEPSRECGPTPLYGWLGKGWHGCAQHIYFTWFWAACTPVNADLIRWDWQLCVNFHDQTSMEKARRFARKHPERVPRENIFDCPTPDSVREQVGTAAVRYAREWVVWVSPSPDSTPAVVRMLAESAGKRIVHVPSRQFDPGDLAVHRYYHLWRRQMPDDGPDEEIPPKEILALVEKQRTSCMAGRSTWRGSAGRRPRAAAGGQ